MQARMMLTTISILFALLLGGCNGSNVSLEEWLAMLSSAQTGEHTANDSVPIPDPSLLFAAVKAGDLAAVRQLLDAGADVNAKEPDSIFGSGDTVLMVSVYSGTKTSIDVVQALLDAGADVNGADSGGTTALMKAAIIGDVHLARLLLEAGADVNAKNGSGNTALTLAATRDVTTLLQVLLDAGADINAQNDSGASALMYTAFPGTLDAVQLLLAAGADVNLRTSDGETALMRAAWGARVDTISALLTVGAEIDAQDDKGQTALMVVVGQKSFSPEYLGVVQALLDAGADVNLATLDGQTALMRAAIQGNADAVTTLLAAGADINLEDADGYTALLFAQKSGADDVVQRLLAAGAVAKDAPPADDYFNEGMTLLESGDLTGAITQFDTAIELKPDHPEAYLRRGLAYLYLDEFQTAFQDLTIAIDLDPQSLDAYQYRGAANFLLGHYSATLKDCTAAISLSRGYLTTVELCYSVIGRMAARDFDAVQDAMDDFNTAIEDDPDLAVAYLFRGFLYFTLGDIETGVRDMEEALRLDSNLTTSAFYVWLFFRGFPDPAATARELEIAQALVAPDSPLGLIFSQLAENLP
jgi:ankyrin repeat protein